MPKKKARLIAPETTTIPSNIQPTGQSNIMVLREQRNLQLSGNTALTSTSASSSLAFLILELPAEIRAMIWRLVVISSKPIRLYGKEFRYFSSNGVQSSKVLKPMPNGHSTSLLNVALANRQVHLEATSVYYKENTFKVRCCKRTDKIQDLSAFLDVIGRENTKLISKIRIRANVLTPFHFLKKLQGLKRLEIENTDGFYTVCWYEKDLKQPCEQIKDLVVTVNGKVAKFSPY